MLDNMVENNELENLEEKPKWGGVRPNSGRPTGSTNKATKEKKEAEQYFKDRVVKSIGKIVNSQMNLAQGCQMLFKIETTKDDKGRETKSRPILITSQDEIENYLAGEYEDGDDYYFITTKRPDNRALDSLVDRVFGKARQNIGLDGGDIDKPIRLFNYVRDNNSDNEDSEDDEKNTGDTGGDISE